MPTDITIIPIKINHQIAGRNNTNNIPIPNPTKHTPNVFFKIFIMISSNIFSIFYAMKLIM